MSAWEHDDETQADPLERIQRFDPQPLAHWSADAAEMRLANNGDWLRLKDIKGIAVHAMAKRYRLQTTYHYGEKEFDMVRDPQGPWVRRAELQAWMQAAERGPPTEPAPDWQTVRTTVEDLLTLVEHLSYAWNGQTPVHPNTAVQQARDLLANLPESHDASEDA